MYITYIYVRPSSPSRWPPWPPQGEEAPDRQGAHTLHPAPYTLHPTPYTLHPTPYTLQPTPYTLYPTPYTVHATPYNLHPAPKTLHPTPYTLHPSPFTLHPSPCTLHSAPCNLNPSQHHRGQGGATLKWGLESMVGGFRVEERESFSLKPHRPQRAGPRPPRCPPTCHSTLDSKL